MIESFSEKVATRVAGEKPAGDSDSVGAPNWTALIELIMQIVTTLLGSCSASDAKLVRAVKSPGLFQRARFQSQVYGQCDSCATYQWRGESGNISKALMQEASDASDAEILTIVHQVRHGDDWQVI